MRKTRLQSSSPAAAPDQKRRAQLEVVRFPGSQETVWWLEERLAEARRGELIGIAAICMYRDREWAASVKGEARKQPAHTRGILPELDRFLGELLRGEIT